ncbi:MAG: hypothetical protein MNPFHGCM_01154 [Gemmatimonadaceae bacterium]|nr:hypothetical protein [Gemmatimonadaceae bacterium]
MARTTTDRFRAVTGSINALQLCGVHLLDAGKPARIADADVVTFRELGALARSVPYVPMDPEEDEIAAYRRVVENVFAQRAIVPAPYGLVFRSRDALLRWIELHYVTLVDAIRFLDARVMARVRVTQGLSTSAWTTHEISKVGHDLEVTAFDSFRVLKKHAVAFAAVDRNDGDPMTLDGAEGAFLLEREEWNAFSAVVREEQRRLPDLRIEQSGPWPPYDFVKLEFGG